MVYSQQLLTALKKPRFFWPDRRWWTVAFESGLFDDCHKAVCWKQTGLVKSASGPCDQLVDSREYTVKQTGFAENATGPCEQIVNSGQQTVAYLIRSFEWLSQGLVTAATLSGFLNDCHKAVWRWQVLSGLSNDSHKAVWWKQMGLVQSVTGPCDQNDFATEFAIIRRKNSFLVGRITIFSKQSDFATEFVIIRSKPAF